MKKKTESRSDDEKSALLDVKYACEAAEATMKCWEDISHEISKVLHLYISSAASILPDSKSLESKVLISLSNNCTTTDEFLRQVFSPRKKFWKQIIPSRTERNSCEGSSSEKNISSCLEKLATVCSCCLQISYALSHAAGNRFHENSEIRDYFLRLFRKADNVFKRFCELLRQDLLAQHELLLEWSDVGNAHLCVINYEEECSAAGNIQLPEHLIREREIIIEKKVSNTTKCKDLCNELKSCVECMS